MQVDFQPELESASQKNLAFNRDFGRITLADFIVRAAYQMGKTPVLPLFAAALGATELLLGFIVSISTLTGMVSKPLFGLLSDRLGRKLWLLIGVAFFSFVPFAYWFVETPQHLVVIRIIHGTATAIFGPVTLAYVAELSRTARAERLGWFSNARSLGYVVGPAAGGYLLLTLSPAAVFTIIGLISCLAFLPVVLLQDRGSRGASIMKKRDSWDWQFLAAFRVRAVWILGGVELFIFVALYAVKAFLPIYALGVGYNSAEIGLFFAMQEAATILLKPLGGRAADRFGNRRIIIIGLLGLAISLPLIALATSAVQMLALAISLGCFQGLLAPTTTALIANEIKHDNLGVGLGFFGTFGNAGKVIGPIAGGLLLQQFSYLTVFSIISGVLLCVAVLLRYGQTALHANR